MNAAQEVKSIIDAIHAALEHHRPVELSVLTSALITMLSRLITIATSDSDPEVNRSNAANIRIALLKIMPLDPDARMQ